MKCHNCGMDISDKDHFCQHCGYQVNARKDSGAYTFVKNSQPNRNQNSSTVNSRNTASYKNDVSKPRCPVCGSTNVDITFIQTGAWTTSREPGAPTKLGRKAMKSSTLGLWGLTGKRTGYSSTAFHNKKMAICKDCGYSWGFLSNHEKEKMKSNITAILITIASIIFFLAIVIFFPSKSDDSNKNIEKTSQVEQGEIKERAAKSKTLIDEFEYELQGNQLRLIHYNGSDETLIIDANYKLQDVNYKTNMTDFQLGGGVKTLIISEGITELDNAIFNESDVEKIYLPKSLTAITDNTLSYLHDRTIEVYYGGSEEQWNSIFEHYVSPGVTESWKAENYEDAGTALADKLNKMMGSEYDPSLFNFYYNSSPDEISHN